MKDYSFETDCICSDYDSITNMKDNAIEITYKTMRRHCNLSEWNKAWGIPLHREWHVTFYKSTYKGIKCYFFTHSAIEYIFTQNKVLNLSSV